MGQRNILCTHQMLDPIPVQCHSFPHTNFHTLWGDIARYPSQNTYLLMPTSGNMGDLHLHQFTGHHGINVIHGDQFNSSQYYHPSSNFALAHAAPYFHNPYMVSSSDTGFIMSEYDRNTHFTGSLRGSCKRKNAEVVTGNYYHANGLLDANTSYVNVSQNQGLLQRGVPYEYVDNMLPTIEALHESGRSRSTAMSLQPQPGFYTCHSVQPSYHHDYFPHGYYYTCHSGQPSSNGLGEQSANYYGDGGYSYWSHIGAMNHMHGRSLHSGTVETVSLNVQENQDASSNRNSAFILHPPSLSDYHQHLPPMQSMQFHYYNQHSQIPAPSYRYPVNNLQTNDVYPPAYDMDVGTRFPQPLPSVIEPIYWCLAEEDTEISLRSPRILTAEFDEFGDVSDQHEDLRMDIDDMSYEELLNLEEWIGDVNTGISEESISKNLNTIMCVSQSTYSIADQSSQLVEETCAICLVEYKENESIGALECGHNYHAGCIKRWLLIRNLCPICKKTALVDDRIE